MDLVRTLRDACYPGAIVGVSTDQAHWSPMMLAGSDDFLALPCDRSELWRVIRGTRTEPIISSLCDEPVRRPLIARMIGQLAGICREIRMAYAAGNYEQVRHHCAQIRSHASSFGFETVAQAAQGLLDASSSEGPASMEVKLRGLLRSCAAMRA